MKTERSVDDYLSSARTQFLWSLAPLSRRLLMEALNWVVVGWPVPPYDHECMPTLWYQCYLLVEGSPDIRLSEWKTMVR
ncbi:unnamed protein product [Somion occarium]|uniref:Uncharacterized protein n=1 Tax=Somion occarium TaxID=3059160 RepID=A0ABP1CVK8_9APHY